MCLLKLDFQAYGAEGGRVMLLKLALLATSRRDSYVCANDITCLVGLRRSEPSVDGVGR